MAEITVGNTEGGANDYDVATGAGNVADTVQRVTLAADDPAVVDLAAIEVATEAAETLLTAIDADTSAMVTALQIIDNIVSGSEAQVDVVTLPGPVYGNTTSLLSTGLDSLASSTTVGVASAEVDVSSTVVKDVLVMGEFQMTTAGSPTGVVEVYAIGSLDGTEYSGDTSYSGTGAAYTLGAAGSANLTLIGVVRPHANTATYRGLFSLASAFGGYVPPFWAIVVVNNSAIALHTSGSTVTYRVIT